MTSVREAAATRLRHAADRVTPMEPLTETFDGLTVDDAYSIQLENIRHRVEAGDAIKGHKVGLSSSAMQQMLGVHEPDYGHLLGSMFEFEDMPIDVGRFIQPRVEIEVAFVLGRPLVGPGITVADVLRATEFVLPSIEIVDSRIRDWRLTIVDTIADNASSGAVVLGGNPTRLADIDVRRLGGTLSVNGVLRESGTSGAVLGNPATAVAWLANKVAAFGVELAAGHVVLPGSFTRMVPVEAGDAVWAEFDRLGHVSCSFSEKVDH